MFPWLFGGAAALALVTAFATWDVTHKMDVAELVKLRAADAAAISAANDKVRDTEARATAAVNAAAQAAAAAQANLAAFIAKEHADVHTYVTPAQDRAVAASRGCVTYGLLRYLDGAATGVDPATLPLPAGVTDDTCAPVEASSLAADIADNYGTARQNAQQLNDLEAAIKAEIDAINAKAVTKPGK